MSRSCLRSVRASYRLSRFPLRYVVISPFALVWLSGVIHALSLSVRVSYAVASRRAHSGAIGLNLVALDLHARRPPIGALTLRRVISPSSLFTFVWDRDHLEPPTSSPCSLSPIRPAPIPSKPSTCYDICLSSPSTPFSFGSYLCNLHLYTGFFCLK